MYLLGIHCFPWLQALFISHSLRVFFLSEYQGMYYNNLRLGKVLG